MKQNIYFTDSKPQQPTPRCLATIPNNIEELIKFFKEQEKEKRVTTEFSKK